MKHNTAKNEYVPTSCRGNGRRGGRGFTLMELLVVIVILAMLMGFIIPNFFGTKHKANIAKAQWGAKQLALAWNEYMNEYRQWPGFLGAGAEELTPDGNLAKILAGENAGGGNPKKRIFFDEITNAVVDPWKKNYWIKFDHDYDNTISLDADIGGGEVRKSVVVWTWATNTADNKKLVIGSWSIYTTD